MNNFLNQWQKKAFARSLLTWYRQVKRDLPWRKTHDPYRIWISEIMLQQTQVDTVKPYYRHFIKALPTVARLAAAPEDQVLKLWEGLGYYSRARNLKRAAEIIIKNQGGEFPTNARAWQILPGIGPCTANAIASISQHEVVPVLDGNVKRVLARVLGILAKIDEPSTLHRLWKSAQLLIPNRAPGDYNQALMELGALVCTSHQPKCGTCPVRGYCWAKQKNQVLRLPVRRKRKPIPHYPVVAGVLQKNNRYLIAKRKSRGLLGGLWEFPGGKLEAGETPRQALQRELKEELGVKVAVHDRLLIIQHAYTHFSITLYVYYCTLMHGTPKALDHQKLKWVWPSHFQRYAFPVADKKIIAYLWGRS